MKKIGRPKKLKRERCKMIGISLSAIAFNRLGEIQEATGLGPSQVISGMIMRERWAKSENGVISSISPASTGYQPDTVENLG